MNITLASFICDRELKFSPVFCFKKCFQNRKITDSNYLQAVNKISYVVVISKHQMQRKMMSICNYRCRVLDTNVKEIEFGKYDSALILPAGLLNILLCSFCKDNAHVPVWYPRGFIVLNIHKFIHKISNV